MAQFTNYLNIPTEKVDNSGYANIFQNLLSGYKAAATPAALNEEMKAKQFQNQLMQQSLDPRNADIERRYKEAQIANLTTPKQASLTKEQKLFEAYQNAPEGPEKDYLGDMIKKSKSANSGVTVFNESGNPMVQVGGSPGDAGRLKLGEQYYWKTDPNTQKPIMDASGNKIPEGILVPTTPAESDEFKGRYMLEQMYPVVNKIQSHYSGKGSNERYYADINAAEQGDKEAIARLTDLAVAQKLISPLTVKEQKTLAASGTLGMYKALQKSISSEDINEGLKLLATFKIPSSINQRAGENWLNIITKTTQEANSKTPAYQKRPFNVENNQSSLQRQNSIPQPAGTVPMTKDGKLYYIPQDKVDYASTKGFKNG